MQHFPDIQLSPQEARVLGCLLEKEILTPDAYPLSLNSLVTACNQTSSRFPITTLPTDEVLAALRELSEKHLVEKILGGRTSKYEHCLSLVLNMQESERAVLTILLLRGPQSIGEIKQRTEQIHYFTSLNEIEDVLTWFIEYPHGPLVRQIPVGAGRQVETFKHLLSETPSDSEAGSEGPSQSGEDPSHDHPVPATLAEPSWPAAVEERLAALEQQVADLRSRLGG
ncbi:MAG: DUF480 domain-containing protein [Akkermansiaceae bacterium]